jgi:23S rRNA pseudouridine2605 synthase
MVAERVQKILSNLGLYSRRQADDMIQEGRVTVNGQVAVAGTKASYPQDAIKVDGKLITQQRQLLYALFYKPRGVMSSLGDPHGRPTIADYVHRLGLRVYPVGRLDFYSEGLMLLTNDGDFAQKLNRQMKAYRVYEVKIKGAADEETLKRLKNGARIRSNSMKMIRPVLLSIKRVLKAKSVIEIGFEEPGVVMVQKLFEMRGLLVDKIVRTQLGGFTLTGMKPGDLHFLAKRDIDKILLGVPEAKNKERQ